MDGKDVAKIAACVNMYIKRTERFHVRPFAELANKIDVYGDDDQKRVEAIYTELMRLNIESVNARYKETGMMIEAVRCDVDPLISNRDALNLINCWIYQSCEALWILEGNTYQSMEFFSGRLANAVVSGHNSPIWK